MEQKQRENNEKMNFTIIFHLSRLPSNGFVLLYAVAKQQFTTPYKIDKPIYVRINIHNQIHLLYIRMFVCKKRKRHNSQDEKSAQLYCTLNHSLSFFHSLSRNEQCTCFCLIILHQLPSWFIYNNNIGWKSPRENRRRKKNTNKTQKTNINYSMCM